MQARERILQLTTTLEHAAGYGAEAAAVCVWQYEPEPFFCSSVSADEEQIGALMVALDESCRKAATTDINDPSSPIIAGYSDLNILVIRYAAGETSTLVQLGCKHDRTHALQDALRELADLR